MFCYGRTPKVEDQRDLTWAQVRPSGLVVPPYPRPHGGFGRDFGDRNWLMLNNGPSGAWPAGWAAALGAGNCTIADKLHAFMESAKNAGRPIPPFSDLTSIAHYQTLTELAGAKYDPQSGANDTGLQIRDVLKHVQNVGLTDDNGQVYRIGPYIAVDHKNPEECWEVLWFTEHVTLGIYAPRSMEEQVLANQMITWVPGSPIISGHDILLAGHPVDNVWAGVQWGMRTPMTEEFRLNASEEAWAWFDPLEISLATGTNYEGVNADQINAYLVAIAQQFPVQ